VGIIRKMHNFNPCQLAAKVLLATKDTTEKPDTATNGSNEAMLTWRVISVWKMRLLDICKPSGGRNGDVFLLFFFHFALSESET
jgi:hypothetical protein